MGAMADVETWICGNDFSSADFEAITLEIIGLILSLLWM